MSDTIEINRSYLLVHEGKDCGNFLSSYFSFLTQQGDRRFEDQIQLIDMEGNSQLSAKLQSIKLTRGFSDVKSLLIIRDAEMNAVAAAQSVRDTLRKLEFPTLETPGMWSNNLGIKVAYLLLPTCNETVSAGTLEDLCINILNSEEIAPQDVNLIKEWMDKLADEFKKEWKRPHKTKLHLCFSINNKFVGKKLGEASHAHAFDWNSPCLQPLKNCIEQGFCFLTE